MMKNYFLVFLFTTIGLIASQNVQAQCPTLDPAIGTVDFGAGIEVCIEPGGASATITFTFLNDGSDFENFLLYDLSNSSFLIPGLSPAVYVHTVGSNVWEIQNVPDEFVASINSKYVFAKAGCPTYGGTGIDVIPTDELRIEDADITVTDNTRCMAPFNGAISIITSGGYGTISYSWTGPGGFSASTQNISTLEPGTYTILVTDGHNCSYSRNIDVADNAIDPVVSISGLNPAKEYCESDGVVVLTGSEAPNGTFSGPGITDNANGTASFDPSVAGVGGDILYTYIDGLGCTGTSTETVTVYPTPSDATNPVDNSYCTGAALTSLSVDDPGAGLRIDWYDASTAGTLVGTGVSFIPATAGTYWAEVVSISGNCVSVNRVSATLTENPLPADAINPVDNSYCAGDAIPSISVDDPGAGFRIDWYDASTGGTFAGTGATFTPATAGIYWAEVVNTTSSCISANRVSATLTEIPLPADASNPVDNSYCAGDALPSISVDDPGVGFRVDWYDASSAGVLVGTGATFTPATAGTYWAEVVNTTTLCISANRVSATLTEIPTPADAINPVDNSYCTGAAMTSLSVDDPGVGLRIDWYDASTAGTLVGTGVSFIPATAGTFWAEVVSISGNCVSVNRVSATLTENPLPADAINPVDNSYCAGDAIPSISVDDPGAGFRIDWYDASTGGTFAGTAVIFTPATAGAYWAEVVNTTTSCISANRVSATLTEIPLPADASNPVDNSYCAGDALPSISVDDPGAGFRIDWYDANTAGTLVGTGATFTPIAAGPYWAEVVNTTTLCIAANRVSATLTEIPTPVDATNPVDNSYCTGAALTSLSVDDPGAGLRIDWYDASTAGTLVGTGVSFIPATAGIFWAEVVSIAGSCISANRVSATLTESPLPADATNSVDNSYCAGDAIPSISVDDPGPGFRIDWYDASTGGTFAGTGSIFTPATEGTYWAEVVNETTGCSSSIRISAILTENPKPTVLTIIGNNSPDCQSSEFYSVALRAGSTYAWTVPANATITAPVDANNVEINFAYADGDIIVIETDAIGCMGDPAILNVTLQNCPFQADFTASATVVCVNSPVTFTDASSGPVGITYSWDFGADASPATDITAGPIVVTYSTTGLKTVSLTIDDGIQNSTETKVDYIDVRPLPTADLSGDEGTCVGSPVPLTFDLTGTGPWDIVYSDGVSNFSESAISTPHMVFVSPAVSTTYTMISVDDALCTGTVSGSASIIIKPPKEITIRLDSITGTSGSNVKVPLRVINFEDMMTMQFTIAWDAALLSYINVSDITVGNISDVNFGTADVNNGFLTFSWNTASWSDTTIVDSTAIFSIDFNVANTVCSDAAVTIDESPAAITLIEIADQNSCLANVTVKGGNVENQLSASIGSSDPDDLICFGDNLIFTGLPGGMPNYQFYLNGVQVQNGANGTYLNNSLVDQDSVNVIVGDAQGCTLAAAGIITTVNQIIVIPTTTDISACGLSDGVITLAVSGGSGNYSYIWTGPSISDPSLKDQSNLARGFYSVTITDDVSGCMEILDIELTEPVSFTLSTAKIDVTSTGGSDGSIDLTITGGTGPFVVSWTGPNGYTSSSQDINSLFAGTYIGTVSDGIGCTDAITIEILQPINVIILNATKTDVSTCGANDGTINLLITGGSGSYGISWTGPNSFFSSNQNLSGLEGGLYIATVIDLVTTLTAQWTVQVDEPEGFSIVAAATDITYCDSDDGKITLTVNGGSGDFSYSWKDLIGLGFTSSNKDITDLDLGSYRVTVTDNVSGCIDSLDVAVGRPAICDQPCVLNVESTTNNTSCPDAEDGVALINIISGGSGPGNYFVSLDTGKTFIPFQGLDITSIIDQGLGSYLYIAKDTITGCQDTTIANVGVSTNLMANIGVTNPGCAENDGIISFNVSGGIIPFEVDIIDSLGNMTSMTGNGFFQFMDLTAGSYFYAIREQSGCSIIASDSIELRVDCVSGCTSLMANAHSFEDATCSSNPDGKAIIDVTGGSSPYEYSTDGVNWIPFISGNVINQLPPNGMYNIVVRQDTLNANCRVEVAVDINGPQPLILENPVITTQRASCNQNDGAVKVGKVIGGINPYNYQIDGSFFALASDSIISNLGAGMHTFTVIDAAGCSEDFGFEVESPGVIVATSTDVPVSCTSIFLKAGIRIEVDLAFTTLPGPYEAYVAKTSDPENGIMYQIPDNGLRTILNLDKDFYTVTINSNFDGGCSYSETISVFSGVYPLGFDIIDSDSIVSCIGGMGSITIGNVTGDPDTTYIVQLISESNTILETYELNRFELEGGFTMDESNTDQLTAGKYYVKMIQNQKECAGVEAVSGLINMYEPLGQLEFEVIEVEISLADRATGFIIGEVIPSGGNPYEALIQLVEPLFELNVTDIIAFNEKRKWEEVLSTGDNLNRYPIKFDSLWAGIYEIYVRDSYGCQFSLEHSIGYDETVFIPNIFTPNNDGFNDVFYIRNLPESGTKLIISNRNGFVVFESDNYNQDNLWDGGDVADGVYYYQVGVPNGDTFKGWIEKWAGGRP